MGATEQPGLEADLLAAVGRADLAAFASLYDRYSRSVFSLALTMLRDAEAAQEVAQEAFLDIWRTARAFDPQRGSARSWILALVHHKAVDAVRRRRLRTTEPLDEAVANHTDVSEVAATALLRGRVRVALEGLPPEQREAIALAYYGGYTQREISMRLGLPLGTVKTRIRDGMLRLRRALEGQLEETER